MLKLIKNSEMVKMPWKNGLGITNEMAIHPPTASFPVDDFQWRVSSAEIKGTNLFSHFNDYDRLLVVWKGEGLILNGIRIMPFTPYKFRGEETIRCELIKSEVLDIGVIYRRDLFECEMDVHHGQLNQKNSLTTERHHTNFVFCAVGLLNVHGLFLQEGDLLQMTGPLTSEITSLSQSTFILIRIAEKKHPI